MQATNVKLPNGWLMLFDEFGKIVGGRLTDVFIGNTLLLVDCTTVEANDDDDDDGDGVVVVLELTGWMGGSGVMGVVIVGNWDSSGHCSQTVSSGWSICSAFDEKLYIECKIINISLVCAFFFFIVIHIDHHLLDGSISNVCNILHIVIYHACCEVCENQYVNNFIYTKLCNCSHTLSRLQLIIGYTVCL